MNEFERISLEFDIALENSEYMMDTIYNVLSIEENNIYLKESSEELSDEELYNMYTDAADKFMEKVKKLFDTIIESIKKFFNQLSIAIKTKIRESQINKKLDVIEKNLATVKTKELTRKGYTSDPRKLVALYKQYTKDVIAVITKYCNNDNSNAEDLKRELYVIESSNKYKDFSLEELDIIGTSVRENINFTKAELRNMDRLNDEILNTSVSAEEKLKEYATKADRSDMVNAIHSAGTKIASAGKKVGKLAYDHPFITLAAIYSIHRVGKKVKRTIEYRETDRLIKRLDLKHEAIDEIIKDRYGSDIDDPHHAMRKYLYLDNKKRRAKYGSPEK